MAGRDGHVRVLPLHVANKIAAGEVVERPASVAKELVENAIDAGARSVRIAIVQGGRKLVAVQDDGCGMCRDDAVLALERQATSKILDVDDIETIDTLGFRGEAIPSIASVSRLSITTRRHDADEGTFLQVNAGTLAEVRAAGCPPGTLVEVRDLFCNVPARRKFLRAYATEESHVKSVFTDHALAHPDIGFALTVDGRELYRLAPAKSPEDRVRELFGEDFCEAMLPMKGECGEVRASGFIERPGRSSPTRHDQHVFVNGRPASAPSVAYALKEAYPRKDGDLRPAAILFIDLPPSMVDVNVHPTKRDVRFRDNRAVKEAIIAAISGAIAIKPSAPTPAPTPTPTPQTQTPAMASNVKTTPTPAPKFEPAISPKTAAPELLRPAPTAIEFAFDPETPQLKPWKWFRFLAQSGSGYLFVETDGGIVTINPQAARERVAYERLMDTKHEPAVQSLLIPEIVRLSPVDASRIRASAADIRKMGYQLEEFGTDTFKIDAIPQIVGSLSPTAVLATIAKDLSEGGARRGERWREELIAKSIARSFAGASLKMTEDGATRLIEELCACKMPYVCPRGKPVMRFTSTRELDRKFSRV